jgi:hypothetical protein
MVFRDNATAVFRDHVQQCLSAPPKSEKKADVAEHPQVSRRVGLPINEPPGTAGLPFI